MPPCPVYSVVVLFPTSLLYRANIGSLSVPTASRAPLEDELKAYSVTNTGWGSFFCLAGMQHLFLGTGSCVAQAGLWLCRKGDLKLLILLPPLLSAGIKCVLIDQLAILFLTAVVLVPGNFLCFGCFWELTH